jgi:antitoxin (DNA-binding transcriptional repressor) of toxin-antitoxin stability system
MKSVKIGELKTHLSKYLRLVRNGEQIRVLDRDQAIAIIGPTRVPIGDYLQSLASQGRVRLGTQEFSSWKKSTRPKLAKPLALKDLLDDLKVIGGD